MTIMKSHSFVESKFLSILNICHIPEITLYSGESSMSKWPLLDGTHYLAEERENHKAKYSTM